MAGLSDKFAKELNAGLAASNEMLKALPTHVYSMPTGRETGQYLAVDFGGTNLRVGLVKLLGNRQYEILKETKEIPRELKDGDGYGMFAFVAEKVKEFTVAHGISPEIELGFTFSFAVAQEDLAHGRIMGWSKEINGSAVAGKDAVGLLCSALTAQGLGSVKVSALVNDTVGTLLAMLYCNDQTKMSVILGTGSNAAYLERVSRVQKLGRADDGRMTIINIEWGSFGDGRDDYLPVTDVDTELDAHSKNPGHQRYEKMISGMYLGEVFRLFLLKLQDGGHVSRVPQEPYSLTTEYMSQLHEADDRAGHAMLRARGMEIAEGSVAQIRRLCESISLRSVQLCAMGVAAVYKRLVRDGIVGAGEACVVAVDGSLYQKYPLYRERLQAETCRLGGSQEGWRIVLVMAEDLSSVGAAAAVAAAAGNKGR